MDQIETRVRRQTGSPTQYSPNSGQQASDRARIGLYDALDDNDAHEEHQAPPRQVRGRGDVAVSALNVGFLARQIARPSPDRHAGALERCGA